MLRLITVLLIMSVSSLAVADMYQSTLDVNYEVTAKQMAGLKKKAIAVLMKRDGLTADQANALVAPDGVLNVQICMEYIVLDKLDSITQAKVIAAGQARK